MFSRFVSSGDSSLAVFVTSSAIVDEKIRDILPLFMEDFVLTWYRPFISEDHEFPLLVEETLAAICRTLEKRLVAIDWTDILMVNLPDILDKHLDNFRNASKDDSVEKAFLALDSHPCCSSNSSSSSSSSSHCSEFEERYLRKVSEIAVSALAPGREFKSLEIRTILVDLLAFSILKVIIESLSEPYVITRLIANVSEIMYSAFKNYRESLEPFRH